MNRIYYIAAALIVTMGVSVPAHACEWWEVWCVEEPVPEGRDTTIYEAPPEPRVEERVVTEETPIYSTRGTDAWNCVDKKTVRKTNLMLTWDGNYLFEDTPCAQDEICITPEEINLANIVKWDEIEKDGKLYGYPGQPLTEAEAQQLLADYLPHAMCKPIGIHNDTCENNNPAFNH